VPEGHAARRAGCIGRIGVVILDKALRQRALDGRPVRIALVGAGYMGRGIAICADSVPGLEVVAISNRTVERAVGIYDHLGRSEPRRAASVEDVSTAIAEGKAVVADNPSLVCRAEGVDVVIEATGELEFAAGVALAAIAGGKHLVLVNAELDATVGPILKARADDAGVVLTNTNGDEPGVTMDLMRYVTSIGLRPVLAGNIKGFLDRHRTPDTQRAFAESVGQDPKRVASYADGTKLCMETAIVANASGFGVSKRGMRGFQCAHVRDVIDLCDPDELLAGGTVDYVLGAEPGSGAFVVGYNEKPELQPYFAYFKLGDGPFYVFYAPWHLPHAEAPLTAARAALFHDAAVAPADGPRCDVVTIAKRDLRAGELLDGLGGFTCYGTIENSDVARRERLLPMGLSERSELLVEIAIDEPIRYDDVRRPVGRLIDRLRAEQDALFA
jgi:predicted homoserine dehydrogenase-like protein